MHSKIDELYKRLSALRKSKAFKPDEVFKTYIGKEYGNSPKRLMMVGKATAGWDADADAAKFVMDKVAEGGYNSAFWHFVRALSCQLNGIDQNASDASQRALERIVWANMMRIGVNSGNPYGAAQEVQSKDCVELLRAEIDDLKPTHLVFTTSNDYWEEVKDTIGFKKPDEIAPDIWGLEHSLPIECRAFWTRHPQGWGADERDRAIGHICEG